MAGALGGGSPGMRESPLLNPNPARGARDLSAASAHPGGSQLAQDRTAATGRGAGLYPGQLLTAPLAAYLSECGVAARLDEYFLDNRVGRPDPRTFSDPRYYSDVLLEVIAS